MVTEFYEKHVNPPVNKCWGVTCNDSNPCTDDSCSAETGNCGYVAKADGTECGIDRTCTAGVCKADGTSPPPVDEEPKDELPILPIAVAVIIVILIIAIGAYYYTKTKGKNKLTLK